MSVFLVGCSLNHLRHQVSFFYPGLLTYFVSSLLREEEEENGVCVLERWRLAFLPRQAPYAYTKYTTEKIRHHFREITGFLLL